ncbi:MFS transporter [Vibrio mediterranei]|uniref:MFS transporter n=1 Tax=Vibrio mediterranei TaxID=689 RepID=UPI0038CE85EC
MKKIRVIGLMLSFGLEVFCTQIIFIYIPLMMLFNGGGEIFTSITRALAYIGPVIFGFYVGSIIDKTNKRASGFVVAFFIAVLTASFGFMSLFNNTLLTIIYLFFTSILTYFLNNLRVTVLPILIKESQLSNANSMLLIIENIALLGAPAISSLLIKFSLPEIGIGLLSFLFLFSSIIYLLSLKGCQVSSETRENIGFISSFRELFRNKKLVVNVLAMMGNNAFVGVFTLYIMIHAYNSGLFTNEEAPFILLASGVGAILSGLLATKAINFFGTNRLVILCGLMLAIFGVLPLFWNQKESYYLAAFGEGFWSSWLVICVWTIRQKTVSKEILGKITGITSSLFKLSMIISIPLSGWISTHFGSSMSLVSASVWILIFIIPICVYSRRVDQNKFSFNSLK